MILREMEKHGESWAQIVGHTFQGEECDMLFDNDYGVTQDVPFTLWTTTRVYFPAVYDGLEWVSSVPRNPCFEKTKHVGKQ